MWNIPNSSLFDDLDLNLADRSIELWCISSTIYLNACTLLNRLFVLNVIIAYIFIYLKSYVQSRGVLATMITERKPSQTKDRFCQTESLQCRHLLPFESTCWEAHATWYPRTVDRVSWFIDCVILKGVRLNAVFKMRETTRLRPSSKHSYLINTNTYIYIYILFYINF